MKVEDLRFFLTNRKKEWFFMREYENRRLLVSSNIQNRNLALSMDKIYDDIQLIPKIKETSDKIIPQFYQYDYHEDVYSKSEILAFLYASINPEWDVIKGKDRSTNQAHFYLKHENYIYDPSLAIVTSEELYAQQFEDKEKIDNKDVEQYVAEKNNLYPYYKKHFIFSLFKEDKAFSGRFLKEFQKSFARKVEDEYAFPEDVSNWIIDNFLQVRQILTQKRKWQLQQDGIFAHPDIPQDVIDQINQETTEITSKMQGKIPALVYYQTKTSGNCYALSILYNIYNGDFKLVQGGITYSKGNEFFPEKKQEFYQHSWLERDGYVYDPEKRIITPKELYYRIFEKRDEYTKDETKAILKRVGCNLTYFKDFLEGKKIGNCESIAYRTRSVDTPERCKEGEELIRSIED